MGSAAGGGPGTRTWWDAGGMLVRRSQNQRANSLGVKVRFKEPLGEMRRQK